MTIVLLCIHNHERLNKHMNDFKIYREGKYDIKANLMLKMSQKLPPIIDKIDDFFVNH